MKNNTLYILSGIQGSGKSTLIKNNELQAITLSYDTFRELHVGLSIGPNGIPLLSNEENPKVFSMLNELLKYRMREQGGNFVIDNMNIDKDSILGFKAIADAHGYNTTVVKFPLMNIEHYFNVNKQRDEYKKMPESSIIRTYEIAQNLKLNEIDGIKVITPSAFEDIIKRKPTDLIKDISSFERVHVFGDLQGSFSVLNKYFENQGRLSSKDYYIFVGDYIDRGIENGKALKFVEKFIDQPNFSFLYGNHERHLMNFANNWKSQPDEFAKQTLPQLFKAGFTPSKMKELFNKMEGILFLQYGDKKIIASHAGYPTIPEKPFFLTRKDEMYGYGGYGFDVDKAFAENINNEEWIQFHGHRNQHDLSLTSYPNSFALEKNVEFGGYLPVVNLEIKGNDVLISTFEVGNDVYNPKAKSVGARELEFRTRNTDEVVAGYTQVMEQSLNNIEIIKLLREHELIKEKTFETKPHISSFNFTRDAFYDSKNSFRDELVSQARGIFLNNETGEIIARGFEKFFNINERGIEQSQMTHVKEHFKTPLQLFQKENGYLGLIGYDRKADELVFTSKSDIEQDFAKNLENIAKTQFSEAELNKLKMFARVNNVNYIFEVNDPINDPHIIKYEKPHLVLLSIVKREFLYQELSYADLKKFSEKFEDLPVKRTGPKFDNVENFIKFYDSVTKNVKIELEGYVVEDANLNRVKIKLPFYNLWKVNRSMKDYTKRQLDKIDEQIEKGTKFTKEVLVKELMSQTYQRIDSHGLLSDNEKDITKKFITWFVAQPNDVKEKDIITLRETFENSEMPQNNDAKKQNKVTNKIKPA